MTSRHERSSSDFHSRIGPISLAVFDTNIWTACANSTARSWGKTLRLALEVVLRVSSLTLPSIGKTRKQMEHLDKQWLVNTVLDNHIALVNALSSRAMLKHNFTAALEANNGRLMKPQHDHYATLSLASRKAQD